MIIARIIGGLGNQMFQYAAARALSERCGVPLRLDLGAFANYSLRTYRLGHLSIHASTTSAWDRLRIKARLSPRLGGVPALTIEHLPVGIATLLNYTAPVFTAVWAALFLGESLDATSIAASLPGRRVSFSPQCPIAAATSEVTAVRAKSSGYECSAARPPIAGPAAQPRFPPVRTRL